MEQKLKIGKKISLENFIKWGKSKYCSRQIPENIKNKYIDSISTDSRTISPGDFFVPVVGEKFNGHDFIEEAVLKGCTGLTVQENYYGVVKKKLKNIEKAHLEKLVIILSRDNIVFLMDLAAHYIRDLSPVVIGITGSVGKTTTKDFTAHILSGACNVKYTPKNYNTEIGIAKSVLAVEKDTRFFVAEVGMKAKGQISRLSKMLNLDVGAITAVGESHLEFFKDVKEIAIAKSEIADNFIEKNGTVFLNNDDKWGELIEEEIKNKNKDIRIIKYGRDNSLDFNFVEKNMDNCGRYSFELFKKQGKIADILLPVSGFHNIYNACCAAAICLDLGISSELVKYGLENSLISENRMAVFIKGNKVIINDCYNANPLSMKRAIDTLRDIAAKSSSRSVAVLADMLELGEDAEQLHQDVGKYLAVNNIDVLICCGNLSLNIYHGFKNEKIELGEAKSTGLKEEKVFYFKHIRDLEYNIGKIIMPGDVILIKGSRANMLEKIIELI